MKNKHKKLVPFVLLCLLGVLALAKTHNETYIGPAPASLVESKKQSRAMGVRGIASWYGESKEECLGCSPHRITKCGIKYVETHYTLASNDFACGTEVYVVYGEKRVLAQINDTGGFKKYGRIADLSKATFASLASLDEGIIEVEIIPKALANLR